MKKRPQNKNLDNLKLFFSDKNVQKKIKEIRRFLNIPVDMYDEESEKNKSELAKEWTNRMTKLADKIIENKEPNELIPFNYLSKNIKDFISTYNLPENYEMSIRVYIMYGVIRWTPTQSFAIIYNPKNKQTVDLRIFQKLTDKDLAEIKKVVNDYYGKNIPTVFKNIKNIDVDTAIEKYCNERDEFGGGEKKSSAKDIVKNVKIDTGKNIKENDVYDIPRKLRKIRERRFKKSGT